jgi:uncharacterized protein YecT (DUF1311 family)
MHLTIHFLLAAYLFTPATCSGQGEALNVDPISTVAHCKVITDPKEAARCMCSAANKADSLMDVEFARAIRDLYLMNAKAHAERPVDTLEVERVKWLQESLQRSQRAWESMRDADRLIAEGADPRWIEVEWQAKRVDEMLEEDHLKAAKRAFASCQQATLDTYDRIRRLSELVPPAAY